MQNKQKIIEIIQPENELELSIILDDEFIKGALYGKPRPGHPEGKVIYHIAEVLKNIDKFHYKDNLVNSFRSNLRLIAIIHDTFKYKVDKNKPKTGENHHGAIARKFAEKYINDKNILTIIELHDEAYNSWQKGNRDNKLDKAEQRAKKLIDLLIKMKISSLYLAFYNCDGETGNKKADDREWFLNLFNK